MSDKLENLKGIIFDFIKFMSGYPTEKESSKAAWDAKRKVRLILSNMNTDDFKPLMIEQELSLIKYEEKYYLIKGVNLHSIGDNPVMLLNDFLCFLLDPDN